MTAFAFTNANMVDMTSGKTILAQTIIVRDGKIEAVGPTDALPVPGDTIRIDATGKTLIPGLYDMHVHISPANPDEGESMEDALARGRTYLQVFLTSGVTTIRSMAGTPLHLALRDEVASGKAVAPRIFTCGPILETRFTFAEMAQFGELVTTPEEARAAVHRQKARGYDFIKVYNDIDAEIYDAIIETAREIDIKVVGHVAFQKGLDGALAAKQDSIEHLRSYDFAADTRTGDVPWERYRGWLHTTHARLDELAERTAAAGVWNAPTMIIDNNIRADDEMDLPRDSLPDFLPEWLRREMTNVDLETVFSSEARTILKEGRAARGAMIAALDRVDAGLLAGTDCPGCGLMPGRSIVQELELMVEAGLSPWRALRTATVKAAEFLDEPGEGIIAPGSRADMVMLDADPLQDIRALHSQSGVMANGRWIPSAEIEAMIASAR